MPPESPKIPIAGIHPVTTINYPGKVAACIFTQGCNLRCPYCHNQELLPTKPGKVSWEETMAFLRRSKRLIEGVVITGGEPTIHPDLPQVIAGIKKEGFLVKLDTNGTNPDMLQELIEEKLIDAVAMDIKTTPDKYRMLGVDATTILRSISLIVRSGVDHEFRTTVDGAMCTEEHVSKIAKFIPSAKKYTVQKAHKLGTGNIEANRDDNVEMTSKVLSNRLS
jgi:pyruvate formate lyase activating enzyme